MKNQSVGNTGFWAGSNEMIWRLIRILIVLAVLAVLGLIGYSYSGFMEPEPRDVTEPVELDGS